MHNKHAMRQARACPRAQHHNKPQTPDILHNGFQVIKEAPETVVRGWDACDLTALSKEQITQAVPNAGSSRSGGRSGTRRSLSPQPGYCADCARAAAAASKVANAEAAASPRADGALAAAAAAAAARAARHNVLSRQPV